MYAFFYDIVTLKFVAYILSFIFLERTDRKVKQNKGRDEQIFIITTSIQKGIFVTADIRKRLQFNNKYLFEYMFFFLWCFNTLNILTKLQIHI